MIAEIKPQDDDGLEDVNLLTAGDLSRRLKISIRQLRRLKAEGLLPEPIMLGRSERWCSSEVTKWIEASCPDRETWEKQRGVELALAIEAR